MAVRERKMSGPSGKADVRTLAKSVRVTMLETGEEYDLPLDAVEGNRKGQYIVSLSADKTKIMSMRPVKGQYIFSFERLGNRKGAGPTNPGVPDTKINPGGVRRTKDGKGQWIAPDELVFTAIFKVESDGPYKGMLSGTNIPYSFAKPTHGEAADIVDSRRNLARLETFLRVAGGMNMATVEIPFADAPTLLTWLEKAIQKMDKKFLGSINENGYLVIEDLSDIPADLLPKAKKAKK